MMTTARLREIIAETGRTRRELALMLGYASHNSMRQASAGRQLLPAAKMAWLEAYAQLRAKHAKAEAVWLRKNPPPG